MEQTNSKAEHKCFICSENFKTIKSLKKHQHLVHKGTRQYECDICHDRFNHKNNLARHKLIHTGKPRKYKCGKCSKSYSEKFVLLGHLKRHEGEAGKTFECEMCQKKFFNRCDLYEHLVVHTNERFHKCGDCSKHFKTRQVLRVHQRCHSKDANEAKPFACTQCDKRCTSKAGLISHANYVHKSEKPFKCTNCEKSFKTQSGLKNHEKMTHLKRRDHYCVFCNKGFTVRGQMFHHLLRHIGEKPFSCELCQGKYFVQAHEYTLHMRKHNTLNFKFRNRKRTYLWP